MFAVEIEFEGGWYRLKDGFKRRDDAEWAIAAWRQKNGSNGKDTGFRVIEMHAGKPGSEIEAAFA